MYFSCFFCLAIILLPCLLAPKTQFAASEVVLWGVMHCRLFIEVIETEAQKYFYKLLNLYTRILCSDGDFLSATSLISSISRIRRVQTQKPIFIIKPGIRSDIRKKYEPYFYPFLCFTQFWHCHNLSLYCDIGLCISSVQLYYATLLYTHLDYVRHASGRS